MGARAIGRRRPGTPALSAGQRRPLRRGSRLLGRQRKSPVGVQNPRPRTSRSPPRRRHRILPRTRGRPRAAPPRDHAAPLAGRDHHQHRNQHPQRAHRSRQRQNQRHKTLSQRLPQPPQPPAPHPAGRRTKTTPNSTRHKNQNPTSQLGRVEPVNDGPSTSGGPWYSGTSGRGYGSNNYTYAYVRGTQNANGEVMSNSSFARWDFAGVPNRNCSIYVYIPSARATAGVYYHIYHGALGNYFGSVFLQQEDHEGWVRLVESHFESAVRLYVLNYEAMGVAPNSDSRGFQYNRIAADASRIVCSSSPTPTSTPAPTTTTGRLPTYPYVSSANPTGSNEYGCRRYHLGSISAGGDVDRWGLFGGECTSYVTFRLNEAGITFHNNFYTNGRGNIGCPAPQNVNAQEARKYRLGHPWRCKWGHATNWDDRAREVSIVVSSIPQIGSVAQWNSNRNGAGPDGHLAYVERVNADGSIVISDMNWVSPGCTVRENMTLTTRSGNWPSNFIYFNQAHNGQTGAAQLFD